jgi:uracil-DNA glycosylase
MILSQFPNIILTKLIVAYARKVDLKTTSSMQEVFAYWQVHLPHFVPLPHPSWRNIASLRRYRWLEAEVVPVLR